MGFERNPVEQRVTWHVLPRDQSLCNNQSFFFFFFKEVSLSPKEWIIPQVCWEANPLMANDFRQSEELGEASVLEAECGAT